MAADLAYEYTAEPDSGLECVVCLEVAEEPWQHGTCGRLLCKECLEKYGRDKPCPNCRKEQPQYFEDNRGRRDIRALKVRCSNAGCAETMERQQLYEHVHAKCLYTVVACKYKGIGCEAELERKDMAAHEQDDKLHLHMAIDTTDSQQEAINLLKGEVNLLKGEVNTLKENYTTMKNEQPITLALPEYRKKKEAEKSFVSPSFYTSDNGYHMALRVDANGISIGKGTHVSVSAPILAGKYDAGLKWPLIGDVTFTLLNQLEDKNHHTSKVSFTAEHAARVTLDAHGAGIWGTPKFIPNSKLAHDPVKNTQYLKDDTLYFKMCVEVADHKPWLECTANQTP